MPKEFNIDDYQYTEEVIPLSQWQEMYKPQPNKFNPEARFGGLLYEHDGEQWEHVVSQQNHYQWTLFQDEDKTLKIKNGLVVRGRIGYFLCEVTHNSHATFIVNEVQETMLAGEDEGSKLLMNVYKYRVIPSTALDTYEENGMAATFDIETLNGELIIHAPDEDTADKMRMTYTDIRMWQRI